MKMPCVTRLCLLSGLLLMPLPSVAHNGAVAIAVPVEGIKVDGDLSDWPEGMRRYPLLLPEVGDAPRDAVDFDASFRLGYNLRENTLYVAVEDWRPSYEGRAEYAGLPRGEYVFEVKAVDRDLNYSAPATVKVQVHLPYGRLGVIAALGLAIAQKSVELLGGNIAVESQVGKGTKFRVKLPARS